MGAKRTTLRLQLKHGTAHRHAQGFHRTRHDIAVERATMLA